MPSKMPFTIGNNWQRLPDFVLTMPKLFSVRAAQVAARFPEDEAPFPIKQHVEVLGFHFGARPHEHPFRLPVPHQVATGSYIAHQQCGLGPGCKLMTNISGTSKLLCLAHIVVPLTLTEPNNNRASPHLRQLLGLGHGSDLAFVVLLLGF